MLTSCAELNNTHQLSHDKNLDYCLFCHKCFEDIVNDGEEYDDPVGREL